jgi:hypothetical protein
MWIVFRRHPDSAEGEGKEQFSGDWDTEEQARERARILNEGRSAGAHSWGWREVPDDWTPKRRGRDEGRAPGA